MTDEELRRLPALLTVPEAGQVLGIGRTVAYQLVRRGEWPTPIIRVGAQIRIPRAPLLDLVGVSTAAPVAPPTRQPSGTIRPQEEHGKGNDGGHHVQEMLLP